MMKQPALHIFARGRNGPLHTGAIRHLMPHVWQHREHLVPGFTVEHPVIVRAHDKLHATMEWAITRKKQSRKWRRAWMLRVIEAGNPYGRNWWPEMAAA